MSAHPPPVPPEQRSNKGPGETGREAGGKSDATGAAKAHKKPIDEKAGRHGAVKQNTTNTGYQQDR